MRIKRTLVPIVFTLLTILTLSPTVIAQEVIPPWHIATLEGHTGEIASLKFSPDYATLASGSTDGTVRLWNTATGQHIATLTGHNWSVANLAFSADNRTLASAAHTEVYVWDVATQQRKAAFDEHTDAIIGIALSANGTTLASGSADKTVQVWDITTGAHKVTLEHSREMSNIALNADGGTVASGVGGTVLLWDVASGQQKASVSSSYGAYSALDFSPSGRTVAAGSYERVELLDASSGREKARFSFTSSWDRITSVRYSADGRTLTVVGDGLPNQVTLLDIASGEKQKTVEYPGDVRDFALSVEGGTVASGVGGTVLLWDVASGQQKASVSSSYGHYSALDFSPNGRTVAAGSYEYVQLLDASSGREKARFSFTSSWDRITSVGYSADGRTLAFVGSGYPNRVTLLDIASEEEKAILEHNPAVGSVAFSADSQILASGGKDWNVRLWDIATGQEKATLEGHTDWVNSVAFNPNGGTLVSGGSDGTVQVWNAATGSRQRTLEAHAGIVEHVVYSPDGTMLASMSPEEIRLWNTTTWQRIATFPESANNLTGVAFCLDGRALAIGNEENVRIWDFATGNIKMTIPRSCTSLAFGDGSRILAIADRGTMYLWNLAPSKWELTPSSNGGDVTTPEVPVINQPTDTVVTPPTDPVVTTPPLVAVGDLELSHGGDVRCVAYSPSGVVLASGSTDNTIRLWRASTGEHLNTLDKHTGDVNTIAFSPNDAYIASGGDGGKLRLWKWSPSADTWVSDQVFTIPGLANNVKSVAFSRDNTMLACGTSGNRILVWDYDSEAQKWVYRHTLPDHSGTVNSVAFSPWSAVLASASDDDTVRLWHARTGEHLDTLDEHTGDVNSIAFSRNDEFIATGSDDDTVILWKWSASDDTWIHHRTLDRHKNDVRSVVFNPNGSVLLSASADKTIGVWNGQTGAYQTSLTEHTDAVNSVAYNFQGNAIASGSDDGTVRQLGLSEAADITDRGIGLRMPSDLISNVAFGSNATYFVLNAQYPTLTGISASDVVYKSCKITIDIPGVPDKAVSLSDRRNPRLDDPTYYMFPLKTPRERISEVTDELAAELTVEIAGLIPIAGDAAGALWEAGKAALAIHAILQSTADPTVTLGVLNLSGQTGRPANEWPTLFLLQNRVSSIGIKVEQKYALKSETKQFWFDPTYTVTYEGTWNLAEGTLAAPSAQLMTLADYPPFQLLPAEVQAYLLRYFGASVTAGDWEIPETTALLSNYPNPFNPETWIPYQLSESADVTLTLYDIQGRVVRHLDLGHQRAGMYHTRSRAAYWDGRNAVGEPVASGIYFYVLKAGDFSATRKMLIRK